MPSGPVTIPNGWLPTAVGKEVTAPEAAILLTPLAPRNSLGEPELASGPLMIRAGCELGVAIGYP